MHGTYVTAHSPSTVVRQVPLRFRQLAIGQHAVHTRPRLPLLASLCCIAAPSSAESSLDSEALQAALSDVRAEMPLGVYSLEDGIEGERVPLVPTIFTQFLN